MYEQLLGDEYLLDFSIKFYEYLENSDVISTDEFFHELPIQFIQNVIGEDPIAGSFLFNQSPILSFL